MPTRKENSVAAGRLKPSSSDRKIVEPERDVPGKTAAINWPTADGEDDGPGDFVAQFFPAQKKFDGDEGHAADEQRPRRWVPGFLRQFEAFFVEDEAHRRR